MQRMQRTRLVSGSCATGDMSFLPAHDVCWLHADCSLSAMDTSLDQQEPSGERHLHRLFICTDSAPCYIICTFRVWQSVHVLLCRYAANGAGIVLAFGGLPMNLSLS